MALHIGTSGWSYNHWEGVLYPLHTPVHARLRFYGACFPSVEINATFYRWPKPATFESWQKRLPPGFLMSVKAPRFLTHNKRLLKPESWLERVVNDLWHLGDKFGVLLVQLSPLFGYDYARLEYFLAQVPKGIRVAVEFRHPSWHREEIFQLLDRRGAAYCIMSGSRLPCILRATAPFVYVRLHGPDQQHLYGGSYSDDDLRWWADRLREWEVQQRDVFVYFNNDGGGNAVRNAGTMRALLGL
jgi:uncharacterized protein YecE (DUF72 family)